MMVSTFQNVCVTLDHAFSFLTMVSINIYPAELSLVHPKEDSQGKFVFMRDLLLA